MKPLCAVLLMGGIAWGQRLEKGLCTTSNIGQPYMDTRKENNPYPLWLCTPDGWMNVHPGGVPKQTGDDCYHAKDGTFHCYQGDIDTPKVIAQGIPISSPSQGEIDAMNKNPLKCGKYEFEDYPSQWCADSMPSSCYKPRCSPLMHTITEKEWQELLQKVRTLEILTDCIGRKEPCVIARTENRP